MARRSNGITACINLITLLIGCFLLCLRIFLATHKDMTCFSLLNSPCLRIGILLVVISLLGLIGSCCRSLFIMWLYLFVYLILILVVAITVLLWIVVIAKGAVRLDVGKPHKLNDFTFWFQDQAMGIADWSVVRKCLIRKDICCHDLKDNFFFSNNLKVCYTIFNIRRILFALGSFRLDDQGCCRQPANCTVNFLTKHDCDVWNRDTKTMCYYCSTCTEGFVSQLAVLWKRLFPGIVILLVVLIIVFNIGCRAFRQNKADHYRKLHQRDQTART
ncbi:tetraspanin-9-like [Chenopodium quinoa]|uniref:tetraspanin-9-like n=1 Tax=Chenopodium quinoa TaxID=63459 RepID=UPI000B794925|nr:tetraspanin-9-like [Chenopodium quinoa]